MILTSRRTSAGYKSFVPRTFGNPFAVTERKYFTSSNALNTMSSVNTSWGSGTIEMGGLSLFNPGQGTGPTDRIGLKASLINIRLRVTLIIPTASPVVYPTNSPVKVRVLLVHDTQCNGAFPATGQAVLGSNASSTENIDSFLNINNIPRFRILRDKTVTFQNQLIYFAAGATNNAFQNGLQRNIEFTYNFRKPLPVRFNTNVGTIASVVDHSFFVMAGFSNNGSPTTAPQISWVCRCSFIDA